MDRPKVQTDDHYTIDKNAGSFTISPSSSRTFVYTTRLRWSKDGKLQQEINYLGTGDFEWEDVPSEQPA